MSSTVLHRLLHHTQRTAPLLPLRPTHQQQMGLVQRPSSQTRSESSCTSMWIASTPRYVGGQQSCDIPSTTNSTLPQTLCLL
jgi:hypothetical protein